jgi:RNase P subunit RPR2
MKKLKKKVALRRIYHLLNCCKKYYNHPILKEYVPLWIELIKKLCMKARIPIRKFKNYFCKKCNNFFVPGETCEIRIIKKKPYIICKCGKKWEINNIFYYK